MLIRAAAFALALLTPAAALAQSAPPPREVAARAAKAIEDLYFDPARAGAIAADLRKEAAAGKYDRLTDPRDLATTLTDRLRPLDGHFSVTYDPGRRQPRPGPGPAGGPPPGPIAEDEAGEARIAYGFGRVEMLPGAIGYINMSAFADFASDDAPARRAADAALTLVSGADAVIIDLRFNGGGSPAMVGYLASAFTPRGAEIFNTFHSREGTESEAPATWSARPRTDVPVFILVSGRTGSAAESFPYTLQAARRAVVVGEPTGGAANPGGPADLGDGFSIFISRGAPINPITRANWEGVGVKPDVAVPAAEALGRAHILALEAVLAKSPNGPFAQDSRWTLEALKAQAAAPVAYARGDYLGTYGPVSVIEEGGRMLIKRQGRPGWAVTALGGDVFFDTVTLARRAVFERDADGRVVALEVKGPTGPVARYRRD
ncbi:MAG: S41 family peptidase [Caulobacter sp.]|nr:S41 family peptidase [Caulobacter sp.]